MTLVFLPGMDGTGALFEHFLVGLEDDVDVIALPQEGCQSYPYLAEYVLAQLPNEPCIIVAESFSGGIIPYLLAAQPHCIQAVIFIASFISSPNRMLLSIAQRLPLKALLSVPFTSLFQRYYLLGLDAPSYILKEFLQVARGVPAAVLQARLKSMATMSIPAHFSSCLPCVYIQPENDKLVGPTKALEIIHHFLTSTVLSVPGPHFILQAQPAASLRVLQQALEFIQQKASVDSATAES